MENFKLTRQALYELVWSEPMTSLAKKYNITDAALRKLCTELQIPLPKMGHWQKVHYGNKVSVTPLPANDVVDQEVELHQYTKDEVKQVISLSPVAILQQAIEEDLKHRLTVPARLTNPDILITKVKAKIEENNRKHHYKDLIHHSWGYVNVYVSIDRLGRALRFMDTLIKTLRARGHDLQVNDSGTYAVVEGEKIEIALREKLNKTIVKRDNWNDTTWQASGVLVFKMGTYDAKEWYDTKQPIEQKLSNILATLELKGLKEKEWRIACQKAEEERKVKAKLQYELEQQQEKELNKFKELLQQAKRWRKAQMLREFIHAVAQDEQKQVSAEWITWAMQKADWYDPLVKNEADLLDGINKDTLILKKSGYYSW